MLQFSLWRASVAALLLTQGAASIPSGSTILTIDPKESQVLILVGKAGVLSFAGHVHEVVAPVVRGDVTVDLADWQRASVSFEFEAAALRVTGTHEAPADVPEVQRVMLSEQVLDVQRFPTIVFRSRRVSTTARTANTADMLIEGDLTLHGTTRPIAIRTNATLDAGGRLTARGAFSLKQTDFGMVPVTAAGGTIRVKDELDVQFVLKANPSHEARTVR
jgi:polyisoprenoid-binding protein YceI